MGGYEGPDWRHIGTATRRAAKLHECAACRESILPGVLYERTIGTIDGKFSAVSVHVHCAAVCARWFDFSGNDMLSREGVIEGLRFHGSVEELRREFRWLPAESLALAEAAWQRATGATP